MNNRKPPLHRNQIATESKVKSGANAISILSFAYCLSSTMTDLTASSPIPFLLRLPPELIDQLLDHVPADQLQRTALSLIQVFPDYPLSSRLLWKHMIVHRAQQLMPLWKKLKDEGRKVDGGMTKGVRTFASVSTPSHEVPTVDNRGT